MVPKEAGMANWSPRSNSRVLLVEDDQQCHQLLRKILVHYGCVVTSAMTQADGLEGIGGGVDCVILDLRLPDGDGEVILEKIRAEHPALRVAVTTAEVDPDRLRKVADLRPDLFLSKPIALPELLEWIDHPAETPVTGKSSHRTTVAPEELLPLCSIDAMTPLTTY